MGVVVVDAIILTGGRSSRLDFTAKSEFVVDERTLLERTLDAVSGTRHTVVVGPQPISSGLDAETPGQNLPPTGSRTVVTYAREDPPFDGPVAGIAAGLAALDQLKLPTSDTVLVLACDMPHIALAIPLLLRSLGDNPESDGAIATDAHSRLQPLAAAYRTASLVSAIANRCSAGTLSSMPVFTLIEGLRLTPVLVPVGATSDVDSWDDAERLGARAPELSVAKQGEHHE